MRISAHSIVTDTEHVYNLFVHRQDPVKNKNLIPKIIQLGNSIVDFFCDALNIFCLPCPTIVPSKYVILAQLCKGHENREGTVRPIIRDSRQTVSSQWIEQHALEKYTIQQHTVEKCTVEKYTVEKYTV